MSRPDAFTAKNWPAGTAPARLTLHGDKTRRTEPAQHVIEFPGGAIELTRTSDGDYWCHVIVNQRAPLAEGSTREQARGEVVGSRIDTADGIVDVPGAATLTQIAVRVRPVRGAA